MTALADTHRCPIAGCKTDVAAHRLMCGYHWHLVSQHLQHRLYRAWSRGAGAGTDDHAEVMQLCIEEVEWKLMEGASLRAKAEDSRETAR